MLEYIQELSASEQEKLKKVIQELFKQTCILKTKYDPVTLGIRDNISYDVCDRHREFIAAYVSVLGCELLHNPQEYIFQITGEGIITEKMSLMTTKIFIILKMIYHEKIMGAGLQATITNLSEIREYGRNTNLINRKMTMQELHDALTMMKTHQMIEIPGAIANLEDNTPIYLYNTINIFLKTIDINELVAQYQTEVDAMEVSEEEESEQSQENIY